MMKRDPFAAAERKGRQAARDGLPIAACPYADHRKPSGKLSWSRAWRNTWLIAYESERVNMGDKPPFK